MHRLRIIKFLFGRYRNKFREILLKVFNVFPMRKAIVFESNLDFCDEGYWACSVLLDNKIDDEFDIYWLVKDRNCDIPDGWNISVIYNKTKNIKEWIVKNYILHTSRYILDSNVFINKKRKGQKRWYLHHGRPIKNCDLYYKEIGKYDLFSIGSDYFKDYYKSAGIDESKMVSYGMLRNDILNEVTKHLVKLGIKKNKEKVIMWMPTFRQNKNANDTGKFECFEGQIGLPTINDIAQLKELNIILEKNNIVLLIKPHPAQDMRFLNINKLNNIKCLTSEQLCKEGVQLYSILNETDALISDYSSIYFDYLLIDKPCALIIDDIKEYEKNVGFISSHIIDDIKTNYITNFEELKKFIVDVVKDNEKLKMYNMEMKYKFNEIVDFTSNERFIEIWKGFAKDKV